MLGAAARVEAVTCAHSLEAEVRELRLIAAHAPPYNRRSKYPERVVWLKLTAEAYPRLSVVRALADDDAAYLGPFSSRRNGRAGRGRGLRRGAHPAVHPQALGADPRRRPARWPSWGGARRPASTGSAPTSTG